jgi:hypothetical protein
LHNRSRTFFDAAGNVTCSATSCWKKTATAQMALRELLARRRDDAEAPG